jgi:hypothetical protein
VWYKLAETEPTIITAVLCPTSILSSSTHLSVFSHCLHFKVHVLLFFHVTLFFLLFPLYRRWGFSSHTTTHTHTPPFTFQI